MSTCSEQIYSCLSLFFQAMRRCKQEALGTGELSFWFMTVGCSLLCCKWGFYKAPCNEPQDSLRFSGPEALLGRAVQELPLMCSPLRLAVSEGWQGCPEQWCTPGGCWKILLPVLLGQILLSRIRLSPFGAACLAVSSLCG